MTSQLRVDRISPATGSEVTIDGFSVESGLASVQTFTSSGTWTKPSGIRLAMVEVIGGGGGGGSSTSSVNTAGGGGGGGAYARKLFDVSSVSSVSVTIGSGGASQGAGGASVFSTVTANGGGAGKGGNTGGGWSDTATATGGDINVKGTRGAEKINANVGGIGGASYFGSSDVTNTGSDTVTVYGAGGWGADGSLDANGAAGASGIVIVTEYK